MNKKLFFAGMLCIGLGSQVSATVLKSEMVKSLKMFMEEDTVSYLVSSLDNTHIVLEKLEELEGKIKALPEATRSAIEPALVNKLKGLMLDPVQQFFTIVHKANWALKPIVEESLTAADLDFKESFLYKFLESSEAEAPTFFDSNVSTMDELSSSCNELIVFFGDLEETMPDTFEKGREYREKLLEEEKKRKEEEEKKAEEDAKKDEEKK